MALRHLPEVNSLAADNATAISHYKYIPIAFLVSCIVILLKISRVKTKRSAHCLVVELRGYISFDFSTGVIICC